jgi:hypothetical protein
MATGTRPRGWLLGLAGVVILAVGITLGAVIFGGSTSSTGTTTTTLPPNTVVVPSLVGEPMQVASTQTQVLDLMLSPGTLPTIPAGSSRLLVASQAPQPGARVSKSSTIEITLRVVPVPPGA